MSARSELSPLLIGQISSVSSSPSDNELTASRSRSNENNEPSIEQQQQHQQRGRANMTRTVVNLMKACLGTGCLALPYACQQGGIITFIIMLISVAAWCLLSIQRLILCLHYLPPDHHHDEDTNDDEHQTVSTEEEQRRQGSGVGYESSSSLSSHKPVSVEIAAVRSPNITGLESPPPPDCTSTLGKVAWHAFGKTGLESVDIMMILCLMGILVSYLVAILGFLQDALFIVTTNNSIGAGGGGGQGQRLFNAIIVSSIMFLLSLVPDLGYLSRASLVGLVLLAATFLVITCYGIYDNENNDDTAAATTPPLALWPPSETGLSRLYGVCIFGYGFVPLTYNFRESMRQPERLVSATLCALGGVTSVNALIGIGLYMLFPHVSGEILHELPSTGLLPTVTRLTMAVVAIMTAPLLIVPMGELLEGKWQLEEGHNGTTTTRWKVRFGICLVSVVIAVLFPSFVHVLSFVGCAFVGLVSFCVPPILLLRLRYIKQQHQYHHHHHPPRPLSITGVVGTTLPTITIESSSNAATSSFWTNSWVDVIMAVAGLVATIAGTISVVADS